MAIGVGEITRDFEAAVMEELQVNQKAPISTLTMIAGDYKHVAVAIAECLKRCIFQVHNGASRTPWANELLICNVGETRTIRSSRPYGAVEAFLCAGEGGVSWGRVFPRLLPGVSIAPG